jgi:hypothetical protein
MARGRLISRTLGSSRKFAALLRVSGKLGEFAQTLYPMLVAHSDDFGRLAGDAFTVKHAVFPTSPRREEEFNAALDAMHAVRLVHRYVTADGLQVLQIMDFESHQPGLHKRTGSKFPEAPVNFPEIPSEFKRTESIGTEFNPTALTRRGGDPLPDGFDAFWKAYPRKKSRADAEKAWRKLAPSPELIQRILDAVAAQRGTADWLKESGRYVPYPASWLNAKRWEDGADEVPQMGPRTLSLIQSDAEFLRGTR